METHSNSQLYNPLPDRCCFLLHCLISTLLQKEDTYFFLSPPSLQNHKQLSIAEVSLVLFNLFFTDYFRKVQPYPGSRLPPTVAAFNLQYEFVRVKVVRCTCAEFNFLPTFSVSIGVQ